MRALLWGVVAGILVLTIGSGDPYIKMIIFIAMLVCFVLAEVIK
jgi:hypothetical protein